MADVSTVADPETGFAVHDSYVLGADNGWIVVGGISVSAPLVSAMIGLAGNAAQLDSAQPLYAHQAGGTSIGRRPASTGHNLATLQFRFRRAEDAGLQFRRSGGSCTAAAAQT